MKDQVIMGPNGELAVAVPLFRMLSGVDFEIADGYAITLNTSKPFAYCLDLGKGSCPLVSSEALKQCEFLGDL
jgi:hypothetical protein